MPALTAKNVLHVDSSPTFRGGQRQVLLLSSAQATCSNSPAPLLLACCARLLEEAKKAGVRTLQWHGPTHPLGVFQLRQAIAKLSSPFIHVHDSRSCGAVRLIASDREQRRLIIHRRIDDPPRSRLSTHWKYKRGEVICVSHAVLEVLASFGVPRERLHLIHSALPENNQGPQDRDSRQRRGGGLRLLALGALVEHKGHRVLLEALTQTSAAVDLRIVGGGPLKKDLQGLIDSWNLGDRVALVGDVEECSRELLAADLLVHPSLSEGLGTAVLDAMLAGLPVLASAVGGLPELVQHEDTGWLVPAGDAEVLGRKIEQIALLYRDEPSLILGMGQSGLARAQQHFPFDVLVRKTRDVYDGINERTF